jgi:hypothetical protein
MYRAVLTVAACAAVILPLSAAGPVSAARAAPKATTLALRVRQPGGHRPMAGALVSVFWDSPPAAGRTTALRPIGSGTAGQNGLLRLTLDAGRVRSADLGDIGAGGANAFNAVIFAFDGTGQYSITQAVIPEHHLFRATATAGTDPATGRPARMTAAAIRADTTQFAHGGLTLAKAKVASTYRYVPVGPLNSATGLRASLTFTVSGTSQRQSEFELPTTEYGGVTLTGDQLEEQSRGGSTGWNVRGNYHAWIWAYYDFVYYRYSGIGIPYAQWEPDHFQGTVSPGNPECCRAGTRKVIGRLAFRQPTYRRGPGGNWAVVIDRSSTGFTRGGGSEQNNLGATFTMGPVPRGTAGAWMPLRDKLLFGDITTITWSYIKGCPAGRSRVLWGQGTDPVVARQVMASCVRSKDS